MTTPTTAVPPIVFGERGFIAPAESDILAGVYADYNAAFGGDLSPALETPQGQLISSTTAIIGNANDSFVFFSNQVDPAYAQGRMQDAIARIYFLERNPAEPTVVAATVTGLNGVTIPAGSLAVATDGNLYASLEAVVIPIGGSIEARFACTATGPIACPAHALNAIYKAIPGWDTIDNAADGVLGNVVESREDFEFRRQQSVFLNSVGSIAAVRGAVLDVAGVLDAYVTDNASNSPKTIGAVTLAAHDLYVAAVGGDPQVIADAIWTKKAPGCPYYAGNTTRTVHDTDTGFGPPFPAYEVTFEIPSALPIKFAVSIANNANVPTDYVARIQAAIISAFAGNDGGPRARIGTTIYASRFYAPIAALGAWVNIISILVGTSSADANSVAVDINRVPTVSNADISVSAT
jgi:hypothetical protein